MFCFLDEPCDTALLYVPYVCFRGLLMVALSSSPQCFRTGDGCADPQ